MNNFLNNIVTKYLTVTRGSAKIPQTREIETTPIRDTGKPATDSFACPYCLSKNFVKRGFRQKKLEKVQLYLCLDCNKTFTQHLTKGKHYPLPVMFDAISIYNLGYSLEQTCRIVNERQQKIRLSADSLTVSHSNEATPGLSTTNLTNLKDFVKSQNNRGVDPGRIAPPRTGSTDQAPHLSEPTPQSLSQISLQPSTLSSWINETKTLCRFERLREYAIKKYSPKDMVVMTTLAHAQLYRYRFHRAKCDLILQDDFKNRRFGAVQEFLESVPGECPHQYFQEGLRASETPLTFSKTQMIVRSKQNYATRLATFVLQSVKDRKLRHEALQKFMLANDSVTVATEIPVYLTCDDIEHLQTQLGFQVFGYENEKLPKLITGHIDFLQIRNGQIHILDYKPNAGKVQPVEQLTLYAMALSRLTGLRLLEFKCAWFDEKDYFEFFPLHVLHKPQRTSRKRKVYTMEGIYKINQDAKKITNIKPI